jgi:5-carboxymethyl-2-hydroxymuconate isomerase
MDVANCKGRAIHLDRYCIGLGDAHDAFVHLEIRLLEGRSAAEKQELGEGSLRILEESLTPLTASLALQITVEVVDIARVGYFKATRGGAVA